MPEKDIEDTVRIVWEDTVKIKKWCGVMAKKY